VAVAGAKQAQNEEEGGGADVSVDAGVADKHAESRIMRGSGAIARFIVGEGS